MFVFSSATIAIHWASPFHLSYDSRRSDIALTSFSLSLQPQSTARTLYHTCSDFYFNDHLHCRTPPSLALPHCLDSRTYWFLVLLQLPRGRRHQLQYGHLQSLSSRNQFRHAAHQKLVAFLLGEHASFRALSYFRAKPSRARFATGYIMNDLLVKRGVLYDARLESYLCSPYSHHSRQSRTLSRRRCSIDLLG